MKNYDLDKIISACDLENVLQAGSNITITKVDDCSLVISSTATGGTSNGIKWHLISGDDITVSQYFQYHVSHKFQIDNNAKFTISNDAQLVVHDGEICNFGEIINNGEIIQT